MTDRRHTLGQVGEALAARELERRGYHLLERNWRCPIGEIDLVAEKEGALVFVEVRTRRGSQRGTPLESVTPAKQAKLIELAQTYCQERAVGDRDWRIDVVAVEMSPRGRLLRIDVVENAVEERQ